MEYNLHGVALRKAVYYNCIKYLRGLNYDEKLLEPDASMDEIVSAAKKACCHGFISELPEGYKTHVGESGASLSGEEKQRISIARAILKDAPVVILDEATASVDPENEIELQKAIAELTREKTLLMIAHRLNTVRRADQILVLDKGSYRAKGNTQ